MKLLIIILISTNLISCTRIHDQEAFTDNEYSLIYLCLEPYKKTDSNRIYYITSTPMSQWNEIGLKDFSDEFYQKIEKNGFNLKKSSYAKYENGKILDKKSGKRQWMIWLNLKKINEFEYEVEEGVWSCPMGGGGGRNLFEFKNGIWMLKKRYENWVS